MPMTPRSLESRFAITKVLVVDDEHYMRKVVRTLLMSIGVRTIYEARRRPRRPRDRSAAWRRDVVILDWEMPGLDGAWLRAHGALARHVPAIPTFRSSC